MRRVARPAAWGAAARAAAILLLFLAPAAAPRPAAAALDWTRDTLTTFEKTTRTVERGGLFVPQDRSSSNAEGLRLRLGFLRLGATANAKARGAAETPIVVIAGAGGVPASYLVRIPPYDRFFQDLRAAGDIILFDQRGLGLSGPSLLCAPSRPLPGDLFASEARAKEILDDAYGQCASTLRSEGLLPEAGNARWAADDLDELRRALGAPKIRLIAAASGTEIALDYLRRYSDRVERAVLVAARGPDQAWRLPSVCDTQIRRLSRFVERDSFYAAHIPDFAVAIRAAIADLDAKPRRVTGTDRRSGRPVELTAGGFALQMILQSDLADPYGFASIPAMLVELKAGGDALFGKRLGLLYNSLSNVMNVEAVAVDCAAGADAGRKERIALESGTSVLGGARVLLQRPELCQAVGVAELGPEARSRIDCDVPTLFLSGGLDANAPPFQSEEIRWGFPNGTHLVVGNGWQELLPIPTVQAAVIDYLRGEEVGGRQLFAPAFRFVR